MRHRRAWLRVIERYGSQQAFGFAIKTSPSVISRTLNGYRELTPEEQGLWGKALGLNSEELTAIMGTPAEEVRAAEG